jgi:hypothetical protein
MSPDAIGRAGPGGLTGRDLSQPTTERERTPPLTLLISMANLLGLTGRHALLRAAQQRNGPAIRVQHCQCQHPDARRDQPHRTEGWVTIQPLPTTSAAVAGTRRQAPALQVRRFRPSYYHPRLLPSRRTQGAACHGGPSWRRRPEPDTEVPRRPTPRPGGPPRCVLLRS